MSSASALALIAAMAGAGFLGLALWPIAIASGVTFLHGQADAMRDNPRRMLGWRVMYGAAAAALFGLAVMALIVRH